MWILTTFGFFSVIQKPEDKEKEMLTVRGRVRADLEALRSMYLPDASPISEDERADYRYRIQINAATFGATLSRVVGDIDYCNFKNAVAERQGLTRHDLYLLVWQVLHQLNICDLGMGE
jgi:hypothetical protein